MATKRYSSYKEIDATLDILRLEKEINFQKMKLSGERVAQSLTPPKIVRGFFGSYKDILSGSYKELLGLGIKYLTQWFINRKRGH